MVYGAKYTVFVIAALVVTGWSNLPVSGAREGMTWLTS
jgi:hypothetical protein